MKYDGVRPLIALQVCTPSEPQDIEAVTYRFPIVLEDDRGTMYLGGDYSPESILGGYVRGLFPWPHEPGDRIWYSSNPRAVLPADSLYVSRRLARTLAQGKFTATVDAAFVEVIAGCTERGDEKTWITPELMECYVELHRRGWAHSFEVWTADGDLAGGLYGIGLRGMFGAESMFHRVTDASKAAMVAMIQHLRAIGIGLIDLQVITDHTERMGAIEIERTDYIARLEQAMMSEVRWPLSPAAVAKFDAGER